MARACRLAAVRDAELEGTWGLDPYISDWHKASKAPHQATKPHIRLPAYQPLALSHMHALALIQLTNLLLHVLAHGP